VLVRDAEQAARLQEQRAKPVAGEPIRCDYCFDLIDPSETAAEKVRLVHAGDCERQWGSAHQSEDDFDETE
jgi:hypothetical protein